MDRTSLTHPLQIAEVRPSPHCGRIGITFCPGKVQPDGATGSWCRDLHIDLDAVRAWGACAALTLVEEHELVALQVPDLGDQVRRRGLLWFHLPIADYAIPSAEFEAAWRDAGGQLRKLLASNKDIVVHCKGGLGRAGTIAARLLIEMGVEASDAIARVRAARAGAIETTGQERYVLSCKSSGV